MKINSFGQVLPDLSPLSRKHLAKWLQSLVYLACDVDGCLIPPDGLETANNKSTVAKFLSRNSFQATVFRDMTNIMVNDGLRIGLCTGRSSTFAKGIVEKMFTPGVCAFMVAEGGAVKSFYNGVTGAWEDHVPSYLDPIAVEVFQKHKEAIIEIGTKELGGFREEGKSVITSFNPPQGTSIDEYFQLFREQLFLLGIQDSLNFEHSSSAVDIGPKGVNKVSCLLEIVGSANTAVLVDAMNDSGVTKEFLVNLMPNNAQRDIQELGMQSMLSFKSEFDALNGTINLFMKIVELRGYDKRG